MLSGSRPPPTAHREDRGGVLGQCGTAGSRAPPRTREHHAAQKTNNRRTAALRHQAQHALARVGEGAPPPRASPPPRRLLRYKLLEEAEEQRRLQYIINKSAKEEAIRAEARTPALSAWTPHLCGWTERIPGGTRQNDGLETGSMGATAARLAWVQAQAGPPCAPCA